MRTSVITQSLVMLILFPVVCSPDNVGDYRSKGREKRKMNSCQTCWLINLTATLESIFIMNERTFAEDKNWLIHDSD